VMPSGLMPYGRAITTVLCVAAVGSSAAATVAPPTATRTLFERLSTPNLVPEVWAQRTPVVRLPGFLNEEDMQSIHELAFAVRAEQGKWHGLATGNWQTTFVNQRLPQLLPELWARMVGAMREADAAHFGVLDEHARHALNLRSAEYHEVLPSGGLPIPKHLDYGSILTIDLMLSDTSEFEGGVFSTLEPDGMLHKHTFERSDAIIFLSHKYHCVSPVTAGRRNVLVAELWEGLPRPCPQRCSDPWGPCYCKYAPRRTALIPGHAQTAYTPPWVRVTKAGTAHSPHFVRAPPPDHLLPDGDAVLGDE